MESGDYTIIIQAENVDLAVQREFTLNVGVPERTVVTVSNRHGASRKSAMTDEYLGHAHSSSRSDSHTTWPK